MQWISFVLVFHHLENQKGKGVAQGFFDQSWGQSSEGAFVSEEIRDLLSDALFGSFVVGNDVALHARPHNFEGMRKGSADHACQDTGHKRIQSHRLALTVEGVEETRKDTLLITGDQPSVKETADAFMSVYPCETLHHASLPALLSGVFEAGLNDGEGVGCHRTGDPRNHRTQKRCGHGHVVEMELLMEVLAESQDSKIDRAAEG